MSKKLAAFAISLTTLLCACAYHPAVQPATPDRDYQALLAKFDATVEQAIYNPGILQTGQWKAFRRDFGEQAMTASNDSEFKAAFETAREAADLFSHFELWISGEDDEPPASAEPVDFSLQGSDIAILSIASFQEAGLYQKLDAAFDEAAGADVAALIIDLRGNPGGNFAAWPVLDRIADREIRIGQLVARPWFAAHSKPPTRQQIVDATPLTRPDGEALVADLMDDGLLALGVVPRGDRFAGRVFVLVDEDTASTSEIVAAALQYNSLATIVGPGSAGEVLNADAVPLDEGMTLLVPLADFMLPNTERLEGRGVVPDVATTGPQAMSCALGLAAGATSC